MSCILRAHIEVKKGGVWYHYSAPRVDEDFRVFELIREDTEKEVFEAVKGVHPVGTHNGLPDDISLVTKTCYEQDCAYAYMGANGIGVLSAQDLELLQEYLYKMNPDVKRTGYDALDLEWSVFHAFVNSDLLCAHRGWDDLRIVYWFDK